jgi:SOS response regulatory protein OraA/RecX
MLYEARAWWSDSSMDRDFANAVIQFAVWRDPARVCEVIAEVNRALQAKGYSAEDIAAALDELLDELEGCGQTRH